MVKKGHVILDLDETLISAQPVKPEDENDKVDPIDPKKAKKFKFHDMDGYYMVFERPGLQEFLDFLFDNFNVSIWTAASKDYALFVVDKIILAKPNRKLSHIFYSYHGRISKKKKAGPKGLKLLWELYSIPSFNPKNTFIIDDLDKVLEGQEGHCISAKAFLFQDKDSEKDKFLPILQKELISIKQASDSGSDITPIIKDINKKLIQM